MYKKNELFSERQKLMMPLGILRGILFVIFFGIYYIFTKILIIFADKKNLINNRYYNLFTTCMIRAMMFCSGVYSIDVVDENDNKFTDSLRIMTDENGDTKFRTVIANHTGAMDIFVTSALLGSHANVSTHEISQIPVFGSIVKLWGGAFVNRSDKNSKSEVKKYIKENIDNYPWLIYPERGDNRGKELLPFQSVAFSLNRKLTPIIIDYGEQTIELAGGFPQKRHPYYPPRYHLDEYDTDENIIINFIKTLLSKPHKVKVRVLNPTNDSSEVIREKMGKLGGLTLLTPPENGLPDDI
jgi:1-acyl-sn-glycerol-3-phosphate acyltransferase